MKTHLKARLAIAAVAFLAPLSGIAADGDHKPGADSTAATADMTDGEVRKIDMEAGKLTLKHGEIKNLDMPGMTMVFVVMDKAMLDKLRTGDKVKFKAINDGGKFTVTEIQPVR